MWFVLKVKLEKICGSQGRHHKSWKMILTVEKEETSRVEFFLFFFCIIAVILNFVILSSATVTLNSFNWHNVAILIYNLKSLILMNTINTGIISAKYYLYNTFSFQDWWYYICNFKWIGGRLLLLLYYYFYHCVCHQRNVPNKYLWKK